MLNSNGMYMVAKKKREREREREKKGVKTNKRNKEEKT